MGVTVDVNSPMTIVHKDSGGVSPVFPDVCKTPTPGGPSRFRIRMSPSHPMPRRPPRR